MYRMLISLLIVCLFVNTAASLPGSGTQADPWRIQSLSDFDEFAADANYWAGCTRLKRDINLAGRTYTTAVIAPDMDNSSTQFDGPAFTGSFDGNGNKIINLTIDDGGVGNDYLGLFGYVDEGEIRNLGFEDNSISGGRYVGGLAGYFEDSSISNCYSAGDVSGDWEVGGLVGFNSGGISNCYSTGDINGASDVGGLVGTNDGLNAVVLNCNFDGSVSGTGCCIGGLVGLSRGSLFSCYSTGIVTGNEFVGGLVGIRVESGFISNCYSTCDVTGNKFVGGLMGANLLVPIRNCYSTGIVTGNEYVGGLVGSNSGDISNCFWDIETSGLTTSAGGTGLPTAEMQTISTFTDAGWDFVGDDGPSDVWGMPFGGGYPILWWQLEILPPLPEFSGGAGTSAEPYVISNADELNDIGHNPRLMDKHFQLAQDIDLDEKTFYTIGSIGYPYTGVFDGSDHTISNFSYTSTDTDYGGLFGYIRGNNAEIKNLGLIDPYVNAGTKYFFSSVGSLVGYLEHAKITDCCVQGGSVSGIIVNVGGLVGSNGYGTITNCYSMGSSISGAINIGGLVGWNRDGTITNCYSMGSVTGVRTIGGLVGLNSGSVSNCYSTGDVTGDDPVGGLVGRNDYADVWDCFWDTDTSGMSYSDGGTGLPTEQMQMSSTFINAGWDFTTPIWTIHEGVDYPRLWWDLAPVLDTVSEITVWTSNRISWEPVVGAVEYYAECAEDSNFDNIVYNSGWITETSYEFTGLQLGQRYWYRVKAKNPAGIESQWSNVESSLQGILAEAIEIVLETIELKSENLKKPYIKKISTAQDMIDRENFTSALNKLENDILPKTDGCAETGEPDDNDWVMTCEGQSEVYPLIIETIEYVKSLIQ